MPLYAYRINNTDLAGSTGRNVIKPDARIEATMLFRDPGFALSQATQTLLSVIVSCSTFRADCNGTPPPPTLLRRVGRGKNTSVQSGGRRRDPLIRVPTGCISRNSKRGLCESQQKVHTAGSKLQRLQRHPLNTFQTYFSLIFRSDSSFARAMGLLVYEAHLQIGKLTHKRSKWTHDLTGGTPTTLQSSQGIISQSKPLLFILDNEHCFTVIVKNINNNCTWHQIATLIKMIPKSLWFLTAIQKKFCHCFVIEIALKWYISMINAISNMPPPTISIPHLQSFCSKLGNKVLLHVSPTKHGLFKLMRPTCWCFESSRLCGGNGLFASWRPHAQSYFNSFYD